MRGAIWLAGAILAMGQASTAFGDSPQWIWSGENRDPSGATEFVRTFTLDDPAAGVLRVAAAYVDLQIDLNGQRLAAIEPYSRPIEIALDDALRQGENQLVIHAQAVSGPSAFFFTLTLNATDGEPAVLHSDRHCLWTAGDNDPQPALELGVVDEKIWGPRDARITVLDDYTQWKRALGAAPDSDPASFLTKPGFRMELVRAAQEDESSWVGLAFDPQGRLVVAREDQGLLRLTLDKKGKVVKTETINDTLQECRGLLFAFDDLYVNANNSKGLYRLRDTTGDDQFDEVKLLYYSPGKAGHGRNDLALGPDNKIYSIQGDSVEVPRDFKDWLSPFREHSRGETSREGFIYRIDAEGEKKELLTAGLRNPFGIDFNRDGEMFTYDADAEFDMGSPWYRPTRVNHLVIGGDFGWRGVTGTWPPYYPNHPDNAPPTLDVGKGSPTGVQFGYKSNFPPAYQDALFILDWAYGRIVAVHMQPQGASYIARPETFLKGRPLNVTNIDFGPDGAMYIATGGRKTRSGVYRVRYVGEPAERAKPTAQQQAVIAYGEFSRGLRRELETLSVPPATAVELLWPHLNSADPSRRHAARIALERQPVKFWQEKTFAEARPTAALTASLALARSGDKTLFAPIIERLNQAALDRLSVSQLETALYTYELCLADLEPIDQPLREATRQKLEPLLPAKEQAINWRLTNLLARLESPQVVQKTLALLAGTEDQADQLHYLFVLRQVQAGWNPERRQGYFEAMRRTQYFVAGQGMAEFRQQIRDDAVAALNEEEKQALGDLLQAEPSEEGPPAPPRQLVEEWTMEKLTPVLSEPSERNFERGREMFAAASCNRCHRIGLAGHPIGPDLTSVAGRFSRRDLLESILKPSKAIAENYQTVRIVTTDGKTYTGRVAPGGDFRAPELRLATDPQDPNKIVEISKSEIETHDISPLSWMPEGLLNTLSQAEILDLLAYLEAGGESSHPLFRRQSNSKPSP